MTRSGTRNIRIQKEKVFERRSQPPPCLRRFPLPFGFPWLIRLRSPSQTRYRGQAPVSRAGVEAVPDQELVGCVEPDPPRPPDHLLGNPLVEECTEFQTPRATFLEEWYEPVQRGAAIDYVLDEQHMLPFQVRLWIVEETDLATTGGTTPIATSY